jgi:Protein of unknown function (DUF2867)
MNQSAPRISTLRRVITCPLPEHSQIINFLPAAHFADCHQFADRWSNLDALATFLEITSHTPAWMNALMSVRNQMVRMVGLKHLGSMKAKHAVKPAGAYRVGERIGIFTLEHLQVDEVIAGDNDKHLHVRVSLRKHSVAGKPVVSISTVVHIHNTLGHLYMSVVGPVHRVIVPLMLEQAIRG